MHTAESQARNGAAPPKLRPTAITLDVFLPAGEEALERLMQAEYAVVLLDVSMPGMDGFETTRMSHDHPRFERTPIIFFRQRRAHHRYLRRHCARDRGQRARTGLAAQALARDLIPSPPRPGSVQSDHV